MKTLEKFKIEELIKIEPKLQTLIDEVKLINDNKVYKYWYQAWIDRIKPQVNDLVGFYTKNQLNTSDHYDFIHDYLENLTPKLK